ncbi:NAD(P)-dependent alcohol dehydrogenase [Spirulina sp. CS-785/01]|uniref:NAD(P)-dependent alcohol dehydrogenase n=1 Tax=Spirulina sp. CS-785/01 TaxID=3021716 RepID=UPI00232AABD7|nr:NAD(P)-dependent alcohol dehydrogenase [Spirulina sp. CS-785/01]MDB9313962.1 NAD(P)-dependent alcohol dehydrogenase [Spirulina sp. CS-785/01]
MKAITISQYGSPDVLDYGEVEKPQVTENELLVRVKGSSVNPIDWKIREGQLKILTGSKFPLYLGLDLSGVVEAVGEKVTRFQPGDEVYASLTVNPKQKGTYGEYTTIAESLVAPKPSPLSYTEAATVPLAALTALQGLKDKGKVQEGQRVLINGASGGVGSFAVQIAKALGAQVTGVCSTRNLDTVKSLGADQVIDYTTTNFWQGSQRYDCVFDAVAMTSFWRCWRVLTPQGHYVTTLPMPDSLILGAIAQFLPFQKAEIIFYQANGQDLDILKGWIEKGQIRPLIDRTYPLSEIAAAHRHSESGHTVGKIALTVE